MSDQIDPNKTTVKQVLPYCMRLTLNGVLVIENTRGERLELTRVDVANTLRRDDLDVHRRKMYEEGLRMFQQEIQ